MTSWRASRPPAGRRCRIDGHDPEAIAAAIEQARNSDRPSLIACRTMIGYGAPNRQGTEKAHGAPLGAEEVAKTRDALSWPHAPFEIPEAVLGAVARGGRAAGMPPGEAGSSGPGASVPMRARRFTMR